MCEFVRRATFYPFAQENQRIGENIETELKFLSQPSAKFDTLLTEDGINKIENELIQKRSAKIVFCVHGCISDLRTLKSLVSRSNNIIDEKVFLGTNVFHPKKYIFQKFDSTTLLIGSCNLT
jgi:HKD family nuclease